ncbi:uncharacterized protein BXZ73DRAFT_106602 [Epithele typhae]|uniref:uncharacterized protein n=1 Tax=Epithele typhae TaxID=378194 RepID=UPI00200898B6|nr:uncharacterized protein BXZ73DRAFT_106602 [Epithele typhae]KAH9914531.1 hypothetical protein BXZ73DRAFT_106602 [Epithele typhae]
MATLRDASMLSANMVPPGPQIAVQSSIAAGLIGTTVGSLFYGVMLLQALMYFYKYKNDQPILKLMVLVIVLAETAHVGISMHVEYHYLISHHADPDADNFATVSIILLAPVSALVILISDIFYARRVWLFNPPYRIVFFAAWASFVGAGTGFVLAAFFKLLMNRTYQHWVAVKWLTTVAFACAAVSDVLVAISLVYHLYRQKTGFGRTDRLVDTLTTYAINTGLVTSLSSLFCVILSVLEGPHHLYLVALSVVTTKFYAISVLVTLNSREYLSARLHGRAEAADATETVVFTTVPSFFLTQFRSSFWTRTATRPRTDIDTELAV